jgi:signal transduction histidine kinase/DNA-binding response OmpR family regulator/ligand-binding sensor domain-containing protein
MKPNIYTFLLLLAPAAFLWGQTNLVERITMEHGLSQGMIFDIAQTRDGFLWIATKDGLNRYDGYNFKIFGNDPFDPFSLAENTVTALLEDRHGRLWVGLQSKGLCLYDPKKERFHFFSLRFSEDRTGDTYEVCQMLEAPDGAIYLFQRSNGMVRVAIPPEWREQLPDQPDLTRFADITLFPLSQFMALGESSDAPLAAMQVQPDGEVWAFSQSGTYLVEAEKGFVRPISPEACLSGHPFMWGALPAQLIRYIHGQPQVFDLRLSGSRVRNIVAKLADDGHFWIAIDEKLWRLKPGETPDPQRPHWVMDARITSAATDRNGNIWVGTQGYGLRKLNLRKQRFNRGASGHSIWGVWSDDQGRYFTKIINRVFPYDPASGTLANQPAFPEGPERILDMHFSDAGTYWLLGRAHAEDGVVEIRQFDPNTGENRSFPFPTRVTIAGQTKAFGLYTYAQLLQDRQGALWATGLECMLARLDPATGRYRCFDYSALFGSKAKTVRAYALAESGDGRLWIGTQMGLVMGQPQGDSLLFELRSATADNPEGLNNNSIACLLPDPEQPAAVLWIGTKGGGINRLDLRSGRVAHFNTRHGLPDNVIYGILPGQRNELWCSTNRGLARIRLDPARLPESLIAFTSAQGLQDNEFNTQAFFKAANGELIFGGINGINRFLPEAVLPDTTPSLVYLVGLRINQQPASEVLAEDGGLSPLNLLRSLDIRHDQNNLSFEFAVLDFTDPGKNRYRYRLAGADPDWVETGTYRFAHFTHLKPGRYTLYAQGNNGEGRWQDLQHPIAITISPPWWRSMPAYLAYLLLLTLLARTAYRFQIRRVQLREELAFKHRETQRLKALEAMKTNFFNNITHEFRTPLTLILEPARLIRAQGKTPELIAHAHRIETNSLKLLDMVNQLLDLAKLESGSMRAEFQHGDFEAAMRELVQLFLPLADERGVGLSLAVSGPLNDLTLDFNKTELIVNNLISNALKFTPPGGKVRVCVKRAAEQSGVEITVADTGMGIAETEQSRIFDRFYQAEGEAAQSAKGTGIGLALSKELAELLGGQLSVRSQLGAGSVFTVYLPEGAAAASQASSETSLLNGNLASAPNLSRNGLEQPLVLLADDNAELRAFVHACIAGQWQVAEASNGEEALAKARLLVPDLVISDVMMPLKNGFELCSALKEDELTAHVPVILLTAKAAAEAKLNGLRSGADDYMTKPFSTEELLARMENLVEQRQRLYQKQAPAPAQNDASSAAAMPERDRAFLQRFVGLVENHLSDEEVSVEDLAKQMLLSRVQLHRKLKAITGQNITDFVRDYRLDRAMAMLRNREGLVYEVAYSVGFKSEKYFSRAFKAKFGVSPSQVA